MGEASSWWARSRQTTRLGSFTCRSLRGTSSGSRLPQGLQSVHQYVDEPRPVDVDAHVAVGLLARPLPQIDVGSPAARLRAYIHLDVAARGLQEAVAGHVCDGERVVHGRALPAVHPLVVSMVEVVQGRDQAADP